MDRFLKFAKIRDYDALLSMSEDSIQELVENFVIDLKSKGRNWNFHVFLFVKTVFTKEAGLSRLF